MAFYYKPYKYYWASYTENGKRIRRVLRTRGGQKVTDEKLARYLINELENQIARGESPIVGTDQSPLVILEEYYKHTHGIKGYKTRQNEYGSLKIFLESANPSRIDKITKAFVRDYLDKRISYKEISHVTANNIIKYLKTFLNFCIEKKYISTNLLNKIEQYKVDQLPPRYLELKEISAILQAAQEEVLFPAIATAIYTGMRLGEIRRLQWADISSLNKTITVKTSKSGKFRVIPIHPELLRVLSNKTVPFDFVNHLRVFRRIRKRSGLSSIGWHTFRHTFATQLILQGVNIREVKELLGHSKIETTVIYAQISPKHLEESVTNLKMSLTQNVTHETPYLSAILG